ASKRFAGLLLAPRPRGLEASPGIRQAWPLAISLARGGGSKRDPETRGRPVNIEEIEVECRSPGDARGCQTASEMQSERGIQAAGPWRWRSRLDLSTAFRRPDSAAA